MSLIRWCVRAANVNNFYNFDEGHGTRIVDTKGINHGTTSLLVTQPTWVTSREAHRKCLDITNVTSATGNNIQMGDILALNSAATYSIGIDVKNTATQAVKTLFDKGATTSRMLIQWSSETNFRIRLANGVANTYGDYTQTNTVGVWYRYLIVFNGAGADNAAKCKLYIDGIEKTAASFTGTMNTTSANMAGSAFKIGATSCPPILIDNLAIWNVALTATDALRDYKKSIGKVRFGF